MKEYKKKKIKKIIILVIIICIALLIYAIVNMLILWQEYATETNKNYYNEAENEVVKESEEEKATIKSYKQLNLTDVDGKKNNYCFTYNNEIYKAKYKKDNWKIIDSYKITNKKDMEIICQALIKIHPIHGKDGVSYRTVEDLVDEWVIHNKAYNILPENSQWKANAKDVDLDPDDQGKTLEDFIKDRLFR